MYTKNICTIFLECEEGKYGGNCTETCACETVNGNTKSCDHVSGECTCNAGWEGITCSENIDECTRLKEPCPPNSACADNDGSYTCLCSTGYIKAGDGTCTGKIVKFLHISYTKDII